MACASCITAEVSPTCILMEYTLDRSITRYCWFSSGIASHIFICSISVIIWKAAISTSPRPTPTFTKERLPSHWVWVLNTILFSQLKSKPAPCWASMALSIVMVLSDSSISTLPVKPPGLPADSRSLPYVLLRESTMLPMASPSTVCIKLAGELSRTKNARMAFIFSKATMAATTTTPKTASRAILPLPIFGFLFSGCSSKSGWGVKAKPFSGSCAVGAAGSSGMFPTNAPQLGQNFTLSGTFPPH